MHSSSKESVPQSERILLRCSSERFPRVFNRLPRSYAETSLVKDKSWVLGPCGPSSRCNPTASYGDTDPGASEIAGEVNNTEEGGNVGWLFR